VLDSPAFLLHHAGNVYTSFFSLFGPIPPACP
jgi:hypothetical protein